MATRVRHELIDDLDGVSEATETVGFAVDGNEYQIDLTELNAQAFYNAVAPFVQAARKVKAAPQRRRRLRQLDQAQPVAAAASVAPNGHEEVARTPEFRAEVRRWAQQNPTLAGARVGDRGRIHESVYAAYSATHNL